VVKLDRSTAAYAVILAVVVCGFALGLYALTPVDQRADMLRMFATPLGALVAAVAAGISAKLAHNARAVTEAQTPVLEKIQKQTNGVLDGRIQDGVRAVLEEAGIVPATPNGAPYATNQPAAADATPAPIPAPAV
jgi:hypothetical protein